MSSTLLTDVVNNNINIPAVVVSSESVTQGVGINNNNDALIGTGTNDADDQQAASATATTCKCSPSIRCTCKSDDVDGKGIQHGGNEMMICDRINSTLSNNQLASNAAIAALYTDVGVCDKAQQQQQLQKKSQQCLLGHRRSESATVTTLSHKNSIKSHRRTVSSITTTTFNCPHRKSSTVIVMLGKNDKDAPKDCTEFIVKHCKVCFFSLFPLFFFFCSF